MIQSHLNFVDRLVDDLGPVRPLSNRIAVIALAAMLLAGFAGVALTLGVRADIISGTPNPIVLLRGGVLLMLGSIAAASALAMVHPVAGRIERGWMSAVAMATVVPAVALVCAVIDPAGTARQVWWSSAINCLGVGLSAAMVFGAIITWQLRRGAPVRPERAGWVTGVAAGSLGVLVYSLHCPANTITYIGLWYGLTVAIAAVVARLAVPRLIRW